MPFAQVSASRANRQHHPIRSTAAINQASQGSITRADENARLDGLLKSLEPKLEEVVRMRMEETTFVDIAAKLGVAEATVRKRYMMAARQLRSQWGESS